MKTLTEEVRVALVDFDGTISHNVQEDDGNDNDVVIKPKLRISSGNIAAVMKMARELMVCLWSGRPLFELRYVHNEVFGLKGLGPMAACQGAIVVDGEGNTIVENPLSDQHAMQLVSLAKRHGVAPFHYGASEVCCLHSDSKDLTVRAYEERSFFPARGVSDFGDLNQAHKLIFIGDPAKINALHEEARHKFPELIYVLGRDDLEALHPLANKAYAAEQATQALGWDPKTVAAFGDGENDKPSFRFAKTSVAMGHAHPALKEVATYVLKAGCPKTALARGITLLFDSGHIHVRGHNSGLAEQHIATNLVRS